MRSIFRWVSWRSAGAVNLSLMRIWGAIIGGLALEEREREERDQAPEGATTLPAVCGSDCAVSAKLFPLCYRHHLV